MSPLRASTLLLLGLGLLFCGVWILRDESTPSPKTAPVDDMPQEATRGTEEDPHARLTYERRRLRDPETGHIPDGVRKKELAFAKHLPERLRKSTSWQPRGPANVGGRSRALAIDVSDQTHQTVLAGGVSGGMWRTTDGGRSWTRTFDPDQRPNVTALAQDPRSERQEVWYAGTGERTNNTPSGGGAIYRGDGIYESTDGGQSWTLLSSTSGAETVFDEFFDYTYAVEVDPSAPVDSAAADGEDSEVYAATYARIYRSTDGGDTWSAVLKSNTGGSYAARTDVEVTSNGEVYAVLSSGGDRSGLFHSPTGDPLSADPSNWADITPDDWPSRYTRTLLAINPSNENEIWALTKGNGSGPNGHDLWTYDRSSDSWTDYTSYLPDRDEGLTGTFNSQGGYDLIIEVHPNHENLLYVGGRNLWRIDVSAPASDAATWIGGYTSDPSDSKFAYYQPSGSDAHHPDQHALAFEPGNGNVMYVGSDGGIHRTDDNRAGSTGDAGDGSVTWTDLNNGYFTTQFYTVCQFPSPDDPTEHTFIAGGMQDNGTWATSSQNVSDPWTELGSGDGGDCAFTNNATDEHHTRYVSTQNGNVYQLPFDQNHSYTGPLTQVNPCSECGQLFINPFAIDPSDADVMYYPAGDSLWRNNDIENNPTDGWTNMTGAYAPSGHQITALGVSATNSENVLYFGTVYTGQGHPADPGKVFRLENANTTSSGTSPTEVTDPQTFPEGGYVSSIAVNPTDSDDVMVVFSNYNVTSLFYSTDGGANWTSVEGNLAGTSDGFGGTTGPSIRSAALLPQPGLNQTTYYVGTSVGVYLTTSLDGANTTWTQEGPSEIGDVVVDQVQARASDGRVIAGTHANGTYSISVPIPVELAHFDATIDGRSVRLTWRTASETNNAGFEVEHKHREDSFSSLGFVEGQGTTNEAQTYEYVVSRDLQPGAHMFRLRQVDADGSASYSEQERVTLGPSSSYSLTEAAPNPFQRTTRMQLTVSKTQPVQAVLYNTLGQPVRTLLDRTVHANRPVQLWVEGTGLASGLYVVQVKGQSFETTRKTMLAK